MLFLTTPQKANNSLFVKIHINPYFHIGKNMGLNLSITSQFPSKEIKQIMMKYENEYHEIIRSLSKVISRNLDTCFPR